MKILNLHRKLRFLLKASANFHIPSGERDIFLFATPRGGSTWLMEILASQPGIKSFDEPLSPRRENVARSGLFPGYESLMPDTGDSGSIIGFLQDLQRGKHGYMNNAPFRRNHRFFTDRCVFKIHEIEHLMHRIEDECGAQIVYLLRHPIATSISRNALPRLDLFLNSTYYDGVLANREVAARIRSISQTGSGLLRAVISWCYENVLALRKPGTKWLTITYEELVLNPARAGELLLTSLRLPDRAAMMSNFERPAANIAMSRSETLAAMSSPDAQHRRRRLVSKWLDQVDQNEVSQITEILSLFEIDAYEAGAPLANARYLHFDDTVDRLKN